MTEHEDGGFAPPGQLPFPCVCGNVVWRHRDSFPSLCWPCWDKAREESIANVAAAIHYIQAVYGATPESG